MLCVSLARHEGDFNVGYWRAREHSEVSFFVEMGENKPLPVCVKRIARTVGTDNHSAVALTRLYNKMNLGVVAQRLKMSHALDRVVNCFLIYYASFSEVRVKTEAVADKPAQDLKLDIAH